MAKYFLRVTGNYSRLSASYNDIKIYSISKDSSIKLFEIIINGFISDIIGLVFRDTNDEIGLIKIEILNDLSLVLVQTEIFIEDCKIFDFRINISEKSKIQIYRISSIQIIDNIKNTENRGLNFTNKNSSDENGNYLVDVFFATNRNIIEKNGWEFNNKRSTLKFGKATISLPVNKSIGTIPRPDFRKLEFQESTFKHVVITKFSLLENFQFFSNLNSSLEKKDKKTIFVFIHGYNVDFKEAIRSTAQIAFDTNFKGLPILFSWPSKGTIEGYPADKESIEYSVPDLISFLKDIRNKTNTDKIHLIAHSLGNQGLTKALIDLRSEYFFKEFCFNQIIMAAPDIDAMIFNQISSKLINCSKQITLYASSKDKALKLSKFIQGDYDRAGLIGENVQCYEGVDTINATGIKNNYLSHGYFGETRAVLTDILLLLEFEVSPDDRNLIAIQNKENKYWNFKPD